LVLKYWKGRERVGRERAARVGPVYITAFIRRVVIVICRRVDSCPTRADCPTIIERSLGHLCVTWAGYCWVEWLWMLNQ
jgi:hypothetical protein